ncbi:MULTISPECIES: nucleoside deaminase [unclassified Iodidimonas]|jgi:tRNA(Arg) A34 adenosine deaminase TadA|uniref:nucleoside deaminase n=1 Tax=unclassified Iodidimonas TaxID=2626145 RepID=UPI0024826604|nr:MULTISPECIES: nucleoside deaminase [unclassified Iodidimonas]
MDKNDPSPMALALAEARKAAARGEVPVGAVILSPSGDLLARAGNEVLARKDPTAHAEMLVIRAAAAMIGSERLIGCDLYVTLEPCAMCAQAISLARIRRLYYGADDQKSGGVRHGGRIFSQQSCHHKPDIYSGFAEREARDLLRGFFRDRRDTG